VANSKGQYETSINRMSNKRMSSYIPLNDVPRTVADMFGIEEPHVKTVGRWATSGLSGLVLQTLKVGSRRITTLEWLMDFFERRSGQTSGDEAEPKLSRPGTKSSQFLDEKGL
jgi:hypothetical protein